LLYNFAAPHLPSAPRGGRFSRLRYSAFGSERSDMLLADADLARERARRASSAPYRARRCAGRPKAC